MDAAQALDGGEAAFALVNARVLTEDGLRTGLAVVVRAGRIAALVGDDDPRLATLRRHDLAGRTLLPGFIDSQCNGGGGVLFNAAPTVESLRVIAAAHRRFGTTGFVATLITDTPEVMHAAADAVAAALAEGVPGVLGLHLEGPFLHGARAGIHDGAKFRVPDPRDLALLMRPDLGVRMLTLAPERVAPGLIEQLTRAGVIVCAGHTAGDHATTRAALDAGLRGFTHLFNAMTPMAAREPGVVGAALEDARSWCGLIVDGHHVHPAVLRIALAAKPRGKAMLVTDAMPPVGGERPDFMLDGRRIVCADGACRDEAGTLAGSALGMVDAVRNTVRLLGVPLDEAARMASRYPAEFLGLAATRGRIAVGLQADFVELDEALVVRATWIGGTRA
ncbi:MAG TPA: N-acetylglucosamine-6-phosphate deacetylase [Methylibium sp.]|uniref:N-acetylglucosamine-6-phosphate deacetylase n=1 Tax=Methylibium sp. TaxID=2067992 RepID=UPI002DB98C5B|nr:N-acetylglucosamine-6-phosphate deacetylase [Methylibium sp.]HEU4459555.1 N-acetylglucosamine-6-phosphate deacetylase [Methylibium sp.]